MLDALDRRARRLRKPRSNLVEQYLAEGLRLDQHPGIAFVDGSSGRRAALASRRGLDVWQVIETLQDNKSSVEAAADVLGVPEADVRAAVAYYTAYRDEIDEEIRANDEDARAAEDAWRREHALLR